MSKIIWQGKVGVHPYDSHVRVMMDVQQNVYVEHILKDGSFVLASDDSFKTMVLEQVVIEQFLILQKQCLIKDV